MSEAVKPNKGKQDILTGFFHGKVINHSHPAKTETILFYLLLIISFFTVVIIYFKADSPYDTGDGIVHYQIARYSWKYPHLFLDLWGKPFFTLISSPFAQFGLKGMYFFQALNSAVISWFLFSIASKINLKYKWTIPAFVFFAPVYFAVMNSGLVEIFFGTMFMFSVWLVFNKKYNASALVASLIPFVRPEAYVVMPLLIAIYIYRKKFVAIPLLFTATVVYTVIGYFHFKDILWIINKNYKLVGDNYAGMKGSYFHYFGVYDEIWGTVYTVLLVLGSTIILTQVYQLLKRQPKHEFVEEVFVLFLGSTIGNFILHSLLCGMPGILNNLGLLRYLAVLIPGSALIALIGLNLINLPVFKKASFLKPVIAISVVVALVWSSFTQWYFPFKPYNEQFVMEQMASYIQTSWPNFKKIYFQNPAFPIYADMDPYDINRLKMLGLADLESLNQLPDSTLLLWDSHFMKVEGKIPFESLSENPNFVMLKHYKFTYDGLPFETCLFLRADNPEPVSVPVEVVYPNGLVSGAHNTSIVKYNFENAPTEFQQWSVLRTTNSDRNAIEFTSEMEFGPAFQIKTGDIGTNGSLKSATLRFNLFQSDSINELVGVVEIRDSENLVSWEGLLIKQAITANQWNTINLSHTYPDLIKNDNYLVRIYIWNKGKRKFYIDDFQLSFEYINERE